ncbi:MAG: hypothetical protein NTX28_03065 [Novosphingobium sp.]|nr:hypothetical protein [Novosphingobium sp.]
MNEIVPFRIATWFSSVKTSSAQIATGCAKNALRRETRRLATGSCQETAEDRGIQRFAQKGRTHSDLLKKDEKSCY